MHWPPPPSPHTPASLRPPPPNLTPLTLCTSPTPPPGESVGVEISGPGCQQLLHKLAQTLGGHDTENEAVGAMFRCLGLEGGG